MEDQMIDKVHHDVVVRPAPDGGVTVNGVGLWPDGPKDVHGFVYGSKGRWTARYNFETKNAEARFHPDEEEEEGLGIAALLVVVVAFAAFCFLVSLIGGWIF